MPPWPAPLSLAAGHEEGVPNFPGRARWLRHQPGIVSSSLDQAVAKWHRRRPLSPTSVRRSGSGSTQAGTFQIGSIPRCEQSTCERPPFSPRFAARLLATPANCRTKASGHRKDTARRDPRVTTPHTPRSRIPDRDSAHLRVFVMKRPSCLWQRPGLADVELSNANHIRTTVDFTRVWKRELPGRRPALRLVRVGSSRFPSRRGHFTSVPRCQELFHSLLHFATIYPWPSQFGSCVRPESVPGFAVPPASSS